MALTMIDTKQDGAESHAPNQPKEASQFHSQEDWNTWKATIQDLYIDQGLKLEDVRHYMRDHHDFCAEIHEYKTRLRKWNIKKNYTARQKDVLLRQLESGSEVSPATLLSRINGKPLKIDRIIRHQRAKKNRASSTAASTVTTQDISLLPRDQDPKTQDQLHFFSIAEEQALRSLSKKLQCYSNFDDVYWLAVPTRDKYMWAVKLYLQSVPGDIGELKTYQGTLGYLLLLRMYMNELKNGSRSPNTSSMVKHTLRDMSHHIIRPMIRDSPGRVMFFLIFWSASTLWASYRDMHQLMFSSLIRSSSCMLGISHPLTKFITYASDYENTFRVSALARDAALTNIDIGQGVGVSMLLQQEETAGRWFEMVAQSRLPYSYTDIRRALLQKRPWRSGMPDYGFKHGSSSFAQN